MFVAVCCSGEYMELRPSQTVCCSVLQCIAARCSVWKFFCSLLQCAAERFVSCSVLHCSAVQYAVVCCSVLQCSAVFAVCCSVLQCVAVRCSDEYLELTLETVEQLPRASRR